MRPRAPEEPLFEPVSYGRRGPGRRDRLSTAHVQQIARTVTRTPEVMVKVLPSAANSAAAVRKHLDYVGRRGDVELETDDGQHLRSREAAADLIRDWDLDLAECQASLGGGKGRPAPKLAHTLVFSMPAGTPADKVLLATQAFCREQWALKHRYAMALHTDEPHPHVHVIVKAVSEQGERLEIRKATLRAWREAFATTCDGSALLPTPLPASSAARPARESPTPSIAPPGAALPPTCASPSRRRPPNASPTDPRCWPSGRCVRREGRSNAGGSPRAKRCGVRGIQPSPTRLGDLSGLCRRHGRSGSGSGRSSSTDLGSRAISITSACGSFPSDWEGFSRFAKRESPPLTQWDNLSVAAACVCSMRIAYACVGDSFVPSAVMRRSAGRQWTLKPQDIAVALKLVALGPERPAYSGLAKSMHLSPFEAHAAVQRLIAARLAVVLDGRVRPASAALKSFLVHGVPYAYPPIRGEVAVGVPTAHGAAPLKDNFAASPDLPPVWPDPNGKVRGQSLLPLYPGLPEAAREDGKFYELAALLDAVRSGQARERSMAARLLEARLT